MSVFDSILRERFTSTLEPYFADERPENWNREQTEIFDIAAEVEYKLIAEVLRLFGVENERALRLPGKQTKGKGRSQNARLHGL